MKKLKRYVIFYRYDRGENYEVYYVGDTLSKSKKEFNKQVVDFYSYGPDDVSQLYLVRFKKLTEEMIENLTSKDTDISSEMLEQLCLGDSLDEFDSFGYDENESEYVDEVISMVNGTDGIEHLVELVEDGEIELPNYDEDEDDPFEFISDLSDRKYKNLLKKYCLPF